MASSVDIDNMSPHEKTTYTWTIGNFSSLVGLHVSANFLRRKQLFVDLVLNGKKDSDLHYIENHYSVYVGLRTVLEDEFNVYCQISLLNQNGEKCNTKGGFVKIVNRMMQSNSQYTFSRAYLVSNGLLVCDHLKIYCEVHVIDKPTNPIKSLQITQNKLNTISHDLLNLLESKRNSDVILVAGGEQFPAHKLILSSRSPVFAAMFAHECEEKKQNRVEISDVDSETLQELLRFIYTDKCTSLDQYSADLMVAADKYQIDSLKSICEESLSTNLTMDTAVKLFVLSDMHSADKLKSICVKYITDHCAEVSLDQWTALETSGPEFALVLLQICLAN